MAELEYAVLADFARVDLDGALTVVGAHRATILVPGLPAQQVLAVAGRLWMGRREPPAAMALGATTPAEAVPVVAQWALEAQVGPADAPGRLSAAFAVTVVAPVTAPGAHALVLSVNGEEAKRLPFTVVVDGGPPDPLLPGVGTDPAAVA